MLKFFGYLMTAFALIILCMLAAPYVLYEAWQNPEDYPV